MNKKTIDGKEYFTSKFKVNWELDDKPISKFGENFARSFASIKDRLSPDFGALQNKSLDLTYLRGVFASSGMNLNRDVFTPAEMFKALASTCMKPINIEHQMEENNSYLDFWQYFGDTKNTNKIVGCIYDAALVFEKTGEVVYASEVFSMSDEDKQKYLSRDDLEDSTKCHIIIAGVLWNFIFPKSIADIAILTKWGYMGLSMEALFTDYDFLVANKIVKKDQDPLNESYFNQGLEVGGSKVGRVLRNVLFSAAGLVENPANPDAYEYITTIAKDATTMKSCASLVFNDIKGEDLEMSIEKLLESNQLLASTNSDLTKKLDAATAQLGDMQKSVDVLKTASASKDAEISALSATVATLEALKREHDITLSERDTLKTKVAELENKVSELTSIAEASDSVKKEKDTIEKELADIKIKQTILARKARLTEAGMLFDMDTDEALALYSDTDFEAQMLLRNKIVASVAGAKTNVVPVLNIPKDTAVANTALASAAVGSSDVDLISLFKKI